MMTIIDPHKQQIMTPINNNYIRLGGIVTADETIEHPRNYAKAVFGDRIGSVYCKSIDNQMSFKMVHCVPETAIPNWQHRLCQEGDHNVQWYYIDQLGVQHWLD